MNKVFNVFVLVFAGGLLATGLLLGYGNEAADCGTPFSPEDSNGQACDALLAEMRQIPLGLVGLGVSLGFATLFANGFAPITPRATAVPPAGPPAGD